MSIAFFSRESMHYQIKSLLKSFSPIGFQACKHTFLLFAKHLVSLKLAPITKIAWKAFPRYPTDADLAIEKISPRRLYLSMHVLANAVDRDICEVGTFTGINLWHLFNQNPNLCLSGCDITLRSVRYAERLVSRSFSSNLTLYKSSDPFNDPRVLSSKNILLDAVVLYLSPAQIHNLLRKCSDGEVKCLILSDLSFEGATSEFNGHYYEHDLANLLKCVPEITFTVDETYKNHWVQKPWSDHGILATIKFN